ncbi:PTS system mannose-specific EIIBCA component [Maioricimonas rarisocia]|uniref:PTS system mannose-specific EIIBCA component n=1 Tax=Maioricimonas rarisocia TaxID=2528026 RepID=A0A517Z9M7_9PLAN|nr:PTS sugar transporter subunit IIA [Maioricimonas rarisocia]QDU39141.1 PTS system mannose-specific EIIBCA component [Maioricimonas rarisocia]
MEHLRKALNAGHVFIDLETDSTSDLLHQVVEYAVSLDVVSAEVGEALEKDLLEREQRFSTAIGHAVAVPHAYLEGIAAPTILFVRLKHPLNMGAPDGIPTRYLFVLVGPPRDAAAHLDTLTTIARLMSDDEFRYDAGEAKDVADLLQALDQFEARTSPEVAAKVETVSPGLQPSGRIGGGLVADIRRRWPFYKSDFTDGLHTKTLGSTLFLYFACLAPTVTFGGLMYGATGGTIGIAETLVATALCGTVYALASGQPLNLLGVTGPLLVFIATLYRLCIDLQIPFMETYTWVGLWTALFCVIFALTDASCLIRYFTRFTDEIFAALISTIFISESLKSIIGYLQDAHTDRVSHDVAFLSLLLAVGTFAIAMMLSRFRRSNYLRPSVREFLADFGPTISVVLMMIFAATFPRVQPEALEVPDSLATSSGRGWLVNPFNAPVWVWGASIVPAMFFAVLVYLDQNITARLVNSPQHRLKKGEGYHLDLLVVALLVGVCAIFGLPPLVAATVRSLNHVRSLATSEEIVTRGGDHREQIIHVRETRLSGLGIHVLIALSLLALPLLRLVPKPVLYGLFLYMGVVSISGNQFFERLNLWLTDPDLYPRTHYTRKVRRSVMHLFTLLQLTCLVVLWAVKASPAGILFPVFIALLVPVRIVAQRFFRNEDLKALDAEEIPEEEETAWV